MTILGTLGHKLPMASLKCLWGYTSGLSQDFKKARGETDGFMRLITQDLAEQELIT